MFKTKTQRFPLNFNMFAACNKTISNCKECYRKESTTTCTLCEQEYYSFDGSDCTGKHHVLGQSTLYAHIYVLPYTHEYINMSPCLHKLNYFMVNIKLKANNYF